MNIAERALLEVFPEKKEQRRFFVKYSGKFSNYNANCKYTQATMTFSLSSAWKEVSSEIQQGVIEHLLCKVYGEMRPSSNQDLYKSFIKHMTKFARVDSKDEYLLSRFRIINEQYFAGLMTEPNLKWGQEAHRKLGHYEYSSDSIVISSVFSHAPADAKVEELLDFVLYHEMLHKKLQYDHKKTRSRHHTAEFRREEKKWPDKNIESKLTWFLRKKKLKKAFFGW